MNTENSWENANNTPSPNPESKPFFETGKHFQESPEPDVDTAALVIERIAKIAEEAGKQPKWDEVMALFDEAENALKRERHLSPDQSHDVEILFGVGRVMDRERLREQEELKKTQVERLDWNSQRLEKGKINEAAKAREKREAWWQQQMALFILKNRNWEGLEDHLNKLWTPLAVLNKKLLGPKNYRIENEQHGIARLVTTVKIFEQLGYECETSGGYYDAVDKIDFVAIKKIAEKEFALIIQAKPTERSDGPETKFETFYPLPERGAEIPEDAQGVVEWVRKNKSLRAQRLAPILARVPSEDIRPNEISFPSGIPKQRFLDNLPKECLDQIRKVEEGQIENPQRHHKRRIVYVNKQR